LEWAKARGCDIVVQLGDFGLDLPDWYVKKVDGCLNKLDMQVWFIDGNHDNHGLLHTLPIEPNGMHRITDRLWHIPRGFMWTWNNTKFMGLGGAVSVDRNVRTPGYDWWPGETISVRDYKLAIRAANVDVMFMHDAPQRVMHKIPRHVAGYPDAEMRAAANHSALLDDIVEELQPKILFHGHFHTNYTAQIGGLTVKGLHKDGSHKEQNMFVWDWEHWNARAEEV